MQLSLASRTTSYSISFQPFILLSIKTCGLTANAFPHRLSSCDSFSAKPLPSPPRAYAARTMTGKPMALTARAASSIELADADLAHFSPIDSMLLAKSSRSSVVIMVCIWVPRTLTPSFSNSSFICIPTCNAVWPPKVTYIASGLSYSMILRTESAVTGRKYTLSARPLDV